MQSTTILPDRIEKADNVYETIRYQPPQTRTDLKNYLKVFLGLHIGDAKICPEHNSPMDYLWHCYSGDINRAATVMERSCL